MKNIIIIAFIMSSITLLNAQPPSFAYTSNPQSGVFRGTITIGGAPATGDDWIAAFDEDGNCAGAAQIIVSGGAAYANLPIYGDDSTTPNVDEGINPPEAFTLKIWDASEDVIVCVPDSNNPTQYTEWSAENGGPIPAYSDFTEVYEFEESPAALPLSLLSFKAQKQENSVQLTWRTADEVNFSHFEVELSSDRKTYRNIGTLEGEGDGNYAFDYRVLDPFPALYFRLKMVDLDDKFTYSKIEVIRCTPIPEVSIYPNPVGDVVFVTIPSGTNQIESITLLNLNGKVLIRKIVAAAATDNSPQSLNIADIPNGIYLIAIDTGGQVSLNKRLVKI